MARHRKTDLLIAEAHAVLSESNPMTLRGLFYQLVGRQVVKNTSGQYTALGRAMVAARKEDLIPWEWIEDRLRRQGGRSEPQQRTQEDQGFCHYFIML